MKQSIRNLLAAFALAAIPLAAPAWAETPAATTAVAERHLKPALWKVADADTTIYLFGTIHALPKGLVWLDGPVASALAESGELVTEIPDAPAAQQQQTVRAIGLLQGETLRSLMSDVDRAAYEALLARLRIPAEAFDPLEPWLAGITLGVMPYAMAGYGADDGVEAVLRKVALAKGKKQGALETVEFQLGLFDKLPREAQLKFLGEAVRDFDKGSAIIGTMTEDWGKGDSDALARLLKDRKSVV